jgi:non-homologous end joining protein Ku
MPRAIGSGVISVNAFVQVPVTIYKAEKSEKLKLKTICTCGERALSAPITCKKCHKDFGFSWQNVPDRVYDAGGGQLVILSKEEMDAAKSSVNYESMQVERAVDFKRVASDYVLGDPKVMLPEEGAVKEHIKAYQLIVSALAVDGRAFLARFTMRGTTYRLCIVADPERGVLVAYEVNDAQPLARDLPKMQVSDKDLAQAKALIATLASDDITFPADPDPLEALLSKKLEAVMAAGMQPTAEKNLEI